MHETMTRLYLAAKELKGVSGQSAVAELLNNSPQALNNWESRGMSQRGMLLAEDVIGVRAQWLRSGEGPMTALDPLPERKQWRSLAGHPAHPDGGSDQDERGQIVLWDKPEDLPQDDSRVWISRYDYSFSAGEGRLQWEVREKGALPFTASFFKAIDSNPRNCKLMSVRGNSMEPFLFDKDLFMVDESKSTIKDGGIYALHFADDCYIKQVFKRPNGGLTLHSYNPAYPDREIQPDEMDAVSVIGKVIYRSGGGFTQ
ncbi:S24 family peptidase [Robbsia andropogonis]|uniref:S24 family peptidase n=1 Tax=Robbsia andropogonis TaxID=28092 RepID=UPI0020A10DA9|nr:S24 family peptidase [Robbsia andropogonis]MCP1121677.1 LexA family transcriptional repressor [Robbsia andropogonis]MCP1131492.1 LexA family transcriptional repressor [Robbsia andropogonis]